MFLCNCIIPIWMNHLTDELYVSLQPSWVEQKHLNFSNNENLWRIFDVLICNCSSFIHLHSHTSGLWALNARAVFSFSSPGSYGICAAAAACWTGLSGGSAEDRAGACFNNACVLEATSGQRPFLKRCFKDAPRPTHVQEPIKNRKSGRTKQPASAEGLQSPVPVINQRGTSYMHLLSRCSHRQWIANGEFETGISLNFLPFFQMVNLHSRADKLSWICEEGGGQLQILKEETIIWLLIQYAGMLFSTVCSYISFFSSCN